MGYVLSLGVVETSESEEKVSIDNGRGGAASRGFSPTGADYLRQGRAHKDHIPGKGRQRGLCLTLDCSEPAILFMLPWLWT